ncbi:hypothetical protein FDP41_010030 [Naegleria fowleri]|uniref:Methyltransferase type 11 domain-containing protein n=1 Tax=Naegleria fowleri TaxID=5763 RepID=A0A6A5AZ90_NAEFO|nr:uncharacterized protein FDP41_010030 [Naegleria fowleri]KAF0971807.1 hypothetical protein FDP41_010030 [Naegleria fowleri]CAG4713706.1 unnamed protein product [Naegleria fowleri]
MSQIPGSASSSSDQNFEPENTHDYKHKWYWDQRFEKEDHYDWLGTFQQWKPYLEPYLTAHHSKQQVKILIVGCGNSTLSEDMYKDGYHSITNMDYSHTVIEKMKLKHPNMEWIEMDMMDMKGFADCTFDIVLDKGTMDALVVDAGDPWDPEPHVREQTRKMCCEVYRVLKPSGRFLQISFSQPHFRKIFLNPKKEDGETNLLDWSYKSIHVDEIGFGYPLFILQKPPFTSPPSE